ncbi:MAG: 2OG-Fe(II) oxygenase [Janthinobacterium lividum]
MSSYADKDLYEKLSDWFINNKRVENYYHEVRKDDKVEYLQYGVDRVGVAYNTTYGKDKNSLEWQRYYQESIEGIHSLRDFCYPFLSPIDHLRVELDELWSKSCHVANFEGEKMFVGIGRIMDASTSGIAEEQPHFDSVPDKLGHLKSQFSANVYLKMPSEGGELEIWDMTPLPIQEIDNAKMDTDWRRLLPKSFLIKPALGDLVFINTRRAHAIRKFNEGKRVTLQCFIGLDQNQSLNLWN